MVEKTFELELDRLADSVNREIRSQLDAALRQAAGREDAGVRRVYESVYDYLGNGGKRMHGVSVILAFRAVGGRPLEAILPVAAGFQLYHHHTLVHDDIYDQDDLRRGLPTLHRAFADWYGPLLRYSLPEMTNPIFAGAAERVGAVAAWAQGKIVHALAFESIFSAPFRSDTLFEVARRVNHHDLTDNAGQIMDVLHEGLGASSPKKCLEIARIKTARLFATGVECAAILGGASESQIEFLSSWIEKVATAYQLQDDLNDLEPDSEKGKGRGVGTDLLSAKPTYLVALAKERATGTTREVLNQWQADRCSDQITIEQVVRAIEEVGALRACRGKAEELVEEGGAMLDRASPALPREEVEFMRQFGAYFMSANYWNRDLPVQRAALQHV